MNSGKLNKQEQKYIVNKDNNILEDKRTEQQTNRNNKRDNFLKI